MKAIHVLTLGAALLAVPLHAQSAAPRKPATMPMKTMKPMAPPSEDMMAMMMSGGMKAKTDVASISLSLRESLDLTPDQVTRLTILQTSSQAEMMQHMVAHTEGMQSAAVMTESAAPDLTAYETALRAAANHMVLEHLAMARADADARAVLTPMQRDRLVLARRVMKERHAGMMMEMKAEMMKDGKAKMGAMPPGQPDTRLP
jgi:hypothetical protein